ncbi:hypothetical protein ciss_20620 [Carboxydothermus islandicus]|uniref:DNA-directed DNA polymerase n=1 Tax=Carboxydothermus islandicus TaxID=661089 RepID=A0A1L8D4M8_9THEO|nr:DNA polymerase III subunit alpha [Carboxydothermus islandicus]GAV26129.1 hypothetical protein ciss_20620 [Carboxydothermus islandicus]
MIEYVPLNIKTGYSFLESSIKLDNLMEKTARLGLKAVGIADTNLFGAAKGFFAAKNFNLKLLLGLEVKSEAGPLWLYARDKEGYKFLVRAATQKYFGKEVLSLAEILEARGLIILGGAEFLAAGLKNVLNFKEAFGDDFYLLARVDDLLTNPANIKALLAIAKKYRLKLAGSTNPCFLEKNHYFFYRLLCAMKNNVTLDRIPQKTSPYAYYLSPDEMAKIFAPVAQSLKTTLEIAEKVGDFFPGDDLKLPEFTCPGEKDEYLRKLCLEGAYTRYGRISREVKERLNYELEIIKRLGLAGYFLIVHDLVRFAKSQDLALGPGRGSAAGSLVLYLLGVTEVDPLKHGLLFERFLNPGRKVLPDVDLDFGHLDREKVIRYLFQKYGDDGVAHIGTVITFAARGAVREMAKALGYPEPLLNKITPLLPAFGGSSIEKALRALPEVRKALEDPVMRKLLTLARFFEGHPRHFSVHASGLVVARREDLEQIPLASSFRGEKITQFDKDDVERLGFLKVDLLGLRLLTVVHRSRRNASIPLNDRETWQRIKKAQTIGCFQLESDGMRYYLGKVAPRNIEELAQVLALFRPGPLESGQVDNYLLAKHQKAPPVYHHPALKPVLEESHGLVLYQEQVLKIAALVAGFDLAKSDDLRRAMSKHDRKIMAALKEEFMMGAVKNGYSSADAEKIFSLLQNFAGYGFNKAHGVSYAYLAYYSAFLITHWPKTYFTFLLNSEGGFYPPSFYLREAGRRGIKILLPDINESQYGFTEVKDGIRIGFKDIEGVGPRAASIILEGRTTPYTSFWDFWQRAGYKLSVETMRNLILAGAFDGFGLSRESLLYCLEVYKLFKPIPGLFAEPNFSLKKEKEAGDYLKKARKVIGVKFWLDLEAKVEKTGEGLIITGEVTFGRRRYTRQGEPFLTLTLENRQEFYEVLVPAFLYGKSFWSLTKKFVRIWAVEKDGRLFARKIVPIV